MREGTRRGDKRGLVGSNPAISSFDVNTLSLISYSKLRMTVPRVRVWNDLTSNRSSILKDVVQRGISPLLLDMSLHESFKLGPFIAPRVWTGLWQLSSTAWGTAPAIRVRQGMQQHFENGYIAFGELSGAHPVNLCLVGPIQIWYDIILIRRALTHFTSQGEQPRVFS